MIKYFLIIFTLLTAFVIGVFGFRGSKFRDTPVRLFPDMEVQDKLKSQKPDPFFENGVGSRLPVAGTLPNSTDDGLYSLEFGEGKTGYYYTGQFGDYYGTGLPEELELTEENAEAFLRRGQERYNIYCSVCHGVAGDGNGVTANYGIPGIANLHVFPKAEYPDGRLYDVITNGKGNMGGYGYNIPVSDRWAIVSYIRTLQDARKLPVTELK